MAAASKGDTVYIDYTGRLDDGSVFDSSEGKDPLEFVLGSGMVIPGFDAAVTGMEVGETQTTHIPAAEAYGARTDELLVTVPKDQLPPGMEVSAGDQLQVSDDEGRVQLVTVVEVGDDTMVIDANHPLAGKDLTFDITLVRIG